MYTNLDTTLHFACRNLNLTKEIEVGCEILERNYVGVDKGAAGHYYIYMHCIKDIDRGHKQCLVSHVVEYDIFKFMHQATE